MAILALVIKGGPITQTVLTFVFPPMFYIYYTRALTSWERFGYNPGFNGLNLRRRSPEGDTPIAWLMIVAIVSSRHSGNQSRRSGLARCVRYRSVLMMQIDIFLFPLISAYLEHKLYGVRSPDYIGHVRRFLRRGTAHEEDSALPEGVAVQVENLRKVYTSRKFVIGKKVEVVAIDDLSFSVPKVSIFLPSSASGITIANLAGGNFCSPREERRRQVYQLAHYRSPLIRYPRSSALRQRSSPRPRLAEGRPMGRPELPATRRALAQHQADHVVASNRD